MSQVNYIFRVILVGDSGVGKTCIIDRYCNSRFQSSHDMTIGVDFGCKLVPIDVDGKTVNIKCHLWDTAGQESYRSITRSYYRNSTIAFICFDTTSYESFNHCKAWIEDIKKECPDCSHIVLVGTKIDLECYRIVQREDAERNAQENGFYYGEVSAKKDININEIFDKSIRDAYIKYKNGEKMPGITDFGSAPVNLTDKNKNWSNCCGIM